jgi:hypothetical protein
MSLAEVTPLRPDQRSLRDIPGMLRSLADLIESGDPDYEGMTQLLVIRNGPADEPAVHGYGDLGRLEDALVLITRAEHAVVTMLNRGGVTR